MLGHVSGQRRARRGVELGEGDGQHGEPGDEAAVRHAGQVGRAGAASATARRRATSASPTDRVGGERHHGAALRR